MEIKIVDCINRMLEFPEIFTLNKQTITDILKYFKETFQCKYFQKEFYEFLSILDGITMPTMTIFSIVNENKKSLSLTFKDYSSNEEVVEYCKGISKIENKEWLFIATDNKGGRFAISKKVPNDKVFYFNRSVKSTIIAYTNFAELLKEKIEETINNTI